MPAIRQRSRSSTIPYRGSLSPLLKEKPARPKNFQITLDDDTNPDDIFGIFEADYKKLPHKEKKKIDKETYIQTKLEAYCDKRDEIHQFFIPRGRLPSKYPRPYSWTHRL
jgi:hypothetical protein